jgi:tRNA(fMet)-specific endonuclease VapC
MAYMAGAKTVAQEIAAYSRAKRHLDDFCTIVDFDERAGVEYQRLRRARIRISTMDLKMAAIVLTHDATLLSRNLSVSGKVPGLRVADWNLPAHPLARIGFRIGNGVANLLPDGRGER